MYIQAAMSCNRNQGKDFNGGCLANRKIRSQRAGFSAPSYPKASEATALGSRNGHKNIAGSCAGKMTF
jgi:hypothetical protein